MKVLGIVVILLGIIVVYIGLTGSQHRIMDILKGIHLSGGSNTGVARGSAGPLIPPSQAQKPPPTTGPHP